MVGEYLSWLKRNVSNELFTEIVTAAEDDIKFNRVGFNKTTTEEEFIAICKMCHTAFVRALKESYE
ncbi:MAG: hypothetical protein ACRC7S_14700 [Cetobacterium sp.]